MNYFIGDTASRLAHYSIPEPNSGCYLWLGSLDDDGYAQVYVPDGTPEGDKRRAHVVAYELENGPVPDGLVLDHLCRNRCCINLDHLEAVTVRENNVRGNAPAIVRTRHRTQTHCKNGHELPSSYSKNGRWVRRRCNICRQQRRRK